MGHIFCDATEIGEIESMAKKGHQKFWRMKIKFFWLEKVKLGTFSTESEKILKSREFETEGNASLPQGG